MTTDAIPILHVADARRAAAWYRRLGFEHSFEHRFEPGFPLYMGLRRDGAQIHLSEHAGDATPDTLVYLWVDHIDSIATEFGVQVEEQPWAHEIELLDPDHNRLRIAQPSSALGADVDSVLGAGTHNALVALESAMWEPVTRGDRQWMNDHLADDFTEFGASGRAYSRAAILDVDVGEIDAELYDMAVRAAGRDAAIVTYRTVHAGSVAHRTSVWVRGDDRWLLASHHGTPVAADATYVESPSIATDAGGEGGER